MTRAQQVTTAKPTTTSRNAICHCGSGKRYKHCCGASAGANMEMASAALPSSAAMAVGATMNAALDAQRRGELRLASDLYRQVLLVEPDNIDALHMLGVIHFMEGELNEAEQLIRYADGLCEEPVRIIQHNLMMLREKMAASNRPMEPVVAVNIDGPASLITSVEDVCAAQEITLPALALGSATDPGGVCSTPELKSLFPAIKTFVLENAVVDAESAIPANRTTVILDNHVDLSRHESPEWRYGLYRRGTAADTIDRTLCVEDFKHKRLPSAIVLTSGYWANWAHFLTEVLPKALIADRRAQWRDWPMLISSSGLRNAQELLRLLAATDRRIVKAHGRMTIDRAGYVSSVGFCPLEYVYDRETEYPKTYPTDCIFSPYALDLVRDAAKRLIPPAVSEAPLFLYLRRNSSTRRFINQDAVEQVFSARGFRIVVPEEFSVKQQIQLFSRAKVIAAPTGAAIANLVFAPRGCQILIFAAMTRYAAFNYWLNMAQAAGHHAQYLFGRGVVGSSPHPAHTDLYFDDLSSLGPIVESAIKDAGAS